MQADLSEDDIRHRFAFHAATTEEKRMEHSSVRQLLMGIALDLGVRLPPGREKALAIGKLEEAMFWANAAIARMRED